VIAPFFFSVPGMVIPVISVVVASVIVPVECEGIGRNTEATN